MGGTKRSLALGQQQSHKELELTALPVSWMKMKFVDSLSLGSSLRADGLPVGDVAVVAEREG